MGAIVTIAVYIFGLLFFVYLIVCEFLDTIGRLEIVESRWPRIHRAMSNRPMRLVLLIFLITLVGKDLMDRAKERSKEPPPLIVNIQAPPPPIVQEFSKVIPSQSPPRSVPSNKPPLQTPPASVVIGGDNKQGGNGPCQANAVGGNATVTDCGTPDPYKPVVTYTPEGDKRREDRRGKVVESRDLERVTIQFDDLTAKRDWQRLLDLVEETRKTDPEWFTLDLESGQAKIGLCRIKEGREDLQKFLLETRNAPDYQNLRSFANRTLYSFYPQCTKQP